MSDSYIVVEADKVRRAAFRLKQRIIRIRMNLLRDEAMKVFSRHSLFGKPPVYSRKRYCEEVKRLWDSRDWRSSWIVYPADLSRARTLIAMSDKASDWKVYLSASDMELLDDYWLD